ncbi:MAG: response regulator transcription factor [Bacteroidota bacterium]
MKTKPRKILLAEDDANMSFMLQDNLTMAGYDVDVFSDGQSALSAYVKNNYDICVLDVMLPKMDGFTLAHDIRKLDIKVPIIFLTAKALKEDRIRGFKLGADDYITKPFSVEEFLLRIETILKRVYQQPSKADEQFVYKIGGLICDFYNQQIKSGTETVQLTHKEAKLLKLFCVNQNKVIERDVIQKAIWEDEGYFVGRSMDVFISRLRKLLKADQTINILNVHGVGYKLEIAGD